ncbi:unnamed protein product [Sphenostylis stenocarpa]|uniref:Uncharacterized protein n=1 Tax=Sphenostylis stenocarpa TaxID=92480 RepID=A0AA86RR05_9FABA|nr:unnamed protein product [Sphenostylis stenocarpa]
MHQDDEVNLLFGHACTELDPFKDKIVKVERGGSLRSPAGEEDINGDSLLGFAKTFKAEIIELSYIECHAVLRGTPHRGIAPAMR